MWKKKKVKNKNKLSGSVVSVKINKLFGDKIPMVVAEFEAAQIKDESYNLTIVGDNDNFKENVEILKSHIIEMLKYKLDLTGKDKTDKIKIINENIEAQEQKIKDLRAKNFIKTIKKTDTEEEKRVQINKIDEVNKLTQLKILKDVTNNEGEGSFETINSKGQRELTYTIIDGMLFPVKYNAATHTMHPANDTKKKIHREQDNDLVDQYKQEIGGGKTGPFTHFLKVCFVILFLVNIGWSFYGIQMMFGQVERFENSPTANLERSAAQCNFKIAELNNNMGALSIKHNNLIHNISESKNVCLINAVDPSKFIQNTVALT